LDSSRTVRFRVLLVSVIAVGGSGAIAAQSPLIVQPAKIQSITVDPPQLVVGPDRVTPINQYGDLNTLSDEHSTILPPGTLPLQLDYLLFVAARTTLNPNASGLVVLRAVARPLNNQDGQWSLDFAQLFGLYQPAAPPDSQNGAVFLTAMQHLKCPATSDPTFDLNYAAPASAFVDPTNPRNMGGGNLILVYEGTNRCIGITGDSNFGNNFFSMIGIATSPDFGLTWPTYKANFTPLPGVNPSQGPNAELGAWGSQVCWGNFCPSVNGLQPPPQFGRYAVSGPVSSISEAIQNSPNGLALNTGDSEPAAFVDTVHAQHGSNPYVYVVHTYNPGPFPDNSLPYPVLPNVQISLSTSRAQLNGGKARLQFTKWYKKEFTEPGLSQDGGGHESPILPPLGPNIDKYRQCLAPSQRRSAASISYSEASHEYLLTFVCISQSDPMNETTYQTGGFNGGAWFYSTIDADFYDLSQQDQWSAPREMIASWSPFPNDNAGCNLNFDGWYPSLMSEGEPAGHLAPKGYVFYMNGCTDLSTPGGRKYSTRHFTMTFQ
jgi:hypothetical protein